jgi:UDP-N-acetylglucosamine acyltransferase
MISNLAHVSPKARIGNNVTIEPFSVIYEDVEIGDNTWIGPNVIVFPDTIIGSGCKIFPTAVIGAVSQDLKYKGEKTNTVIGNNTIIREAVTIHKGTADKYTTKVGDNCMLMAYVHVAHDCIIGNNVILANSVGLSGHVIINDFAIIEGMCGVSQFAVIGAHSFVAGYSQIRKNIPPYIKVAREPLQYIGVNSIGLARRGFAKEVITQIEDIYRLIFVRGHNISNALELVDQEIAPSEVKTQIIDFIRSSKDGIVRGI